MSTSPAYADWYHDPELFDWLFGILVKHPRPAGRYLTSLASSAKHASSDEYSRLRAVLLEEKAEHPEFRRPPLNSSSSKPA